jgi:6-phosphogluconolactonase
MADDVELIVLPDEEAAARAAAERLVAHAQRGGDVVLTGGSTPRRTYELTAELAPDWSRVRVWWDDERCVPPDDERSNYRLARESLLDRLATPPEAIHRIRGELTPQDAADAYDAELAGVALDFVLLGLGPDGHVSSLFPNEPSLEERGRRAIATEARLEPFVPRVSMTLPVLCSAPEVVFLVAGESKADAVGRAFGGPPSPSTPGSLVRSRKGTTTAILDRQAASQLRA